MKNLLMLFLFLFIGCTLSKHKTKAKNDTSITNEVHRSEKSSVKENTTQQKSLSDSTVFNANYNIDRIKTATLQNFSLKNNGRCADPGSIRIIQFTDVLGNKTSIPVNDNTDLSFGSESEINKEIEAYKTEVVKLKKENETLKQDKEALLTTKTAQKSDIRVKASKMDVEKEIYPFWVFVVVGVLSIALWEIEKKLIKKYFFK